MAQSDVTQEPQFKVLGADSVKFTITEVDDDAQQTICSASTIDKELKEESDKLSSNCNSSSIVGKLLAKRAIKKGIKQVIFDRGGNLYHGRVKALADAARDAGLNF